MNIGLDLDGTVYRSQTLIQGCYEAIHDLNENHNLIFLTNNGSITPLTIKEKLENLLKIHLSLNDLVTPLNVTEHVLSDNVETIYIHGTEIIKNYMRDMNLNISDTLESSSILLIGKFSNFINNDIEKYANFHSEGNKIFTFNKDMTYPTAEGFELGTGALVAEIENHIGVSIESFGKPSDYYLDYLLSKYTKFNYIVGDRLDTDMVLGSKLDSNCSLVETGVYQPGEPLPESIDIKVYKNLKEFALSL